MIVVTRFNDSQFAINADLIERIHESPDTTLVMLDGAKYIVTESMSDVITLITEYRARVIRLASALPTVSSSTELAERASGRKLELVEQPREPKPTTHRN